MLPTGGAASHRTITGIFCVAPIDDHDDNTSLGILIEGINGNNMASNTTSIKVNKQLHDNNQPGGRTSYIYAALQQWYNGCFFAMRQSTTTTIFLLELALNDSKGNRRTNKVNKSSTQ
jgi:hypothetical protein